MSKNKKPSGPALVLSGEHRLNKLLAAAGLGSRRQCEELIEQGRVEVDGQTVTSLSKKADPAKSKIVVDGNSLRQHRPVYFAVNKPSGVLCTNRDPQGRPRVVDLVPGHSRLFPVGRLDSSSIGLILLTNDGELAQRLAHPSYGVAKTYFVVVQGQVQPQDLAKLRKGIYLAEGVARVEGAKIRRVRKGATELEIILTEGKNREIRRVLARFGHKVVVLRRLAIGPLRLGTLPEGMHRPLTSTEVASLYRAAEEAKRAKTKPRVAIEDSGADVKQPERVAKAISSKTVRKRADVDEKHGTTLLEVRPPQLDGHDMDLQFSRRQGGVIAFDDDDDELVDSGQGTLEDELLDDYDSDDDTPALPPKRVKAKGKPESKSEDRRSQRAINPSERNAKQQFNGRSEASRQLTSPKRAQPAQRSKGSLGNTRAETAQQKPQSLKNSKGNSKLEMKVRSKTARVNLSSKSTPSHKTAESTRKKAIAKDRQPAKKAHLRSGGAPATGRRDSRSGIVTMHSGGVRRSSNTQRGRKKK